MTFFLCRHCGSPRQGGSPAYRCTCIPSHVWEDPGMAQAVRTLNLSAVIRFLRRHPDTEHLPQSALANISGLSPSVVSRLESGGHATNIRRCVEALEALGAPRAADEDRPGPRGNRRPAHPQAPSSDPGVPCVVITCPVPVYVQVVDPSTDPGAQPPRHRGEIAFVADEAGPRLILTRDTTWGVNSTPSGATAWFALDPSATPALESGSSSPEPQPQTDTTAG
ncbi:helix-turn-helix domain-containing protein [Nocardiopsis sp. CNT312]|uniref:helix-turn-helix domain-containing protein n=1 Tax=Nocardiopsis sp. CNT312 TaxID=1137268 RepID=UPI00048E90E0|nr:helix-turn-helix transcriptional regulator [Nocardiopsis sp. CNT312]